MSVITQINNKHKQLLAVGTFPESLGIYPAIGNEKPNGGELFDGNTRIGAYQEYDGGLIYWSTNPSNTSEAFEVHGKIREKYASLGWERSFLLFPTTDQTPTLSSRGFQNEFEGGIIMHKSGNTEAFEVHGAIYQMYKQYGLDLGSLGFPISDETSISGSDCKFSNFENGTIYWTPSTGAHVITAPFVMITNITRTPVHARFFNPAEQNINGPTLADGYRNIPSHSTIFWKLPANLQSVKVAFDGEHGGVNFGSTVKIIRAGVNHVFNVNEAVTIRFSTHNLSSQPITVRIYDNAEPVHLPGVTLLNGTSPQGDVSTGAFLLGPNLELDYLMPDDVSAIKIQFNSEPLIQAVVRGQRVVHTDSSKRVAFKNTSNRPIRFLVFNDNGTPLTFFLNGGDIRIMASNNPAPQFYNALSDCITAPHVFVKFDVSFPDWIGHDDRITAGGIPAEFGDLITFNGATIIKSKFE